MSYTKRSLDSAWGDEKQGIRISSTHHPISFSNGTGSSTGPPSPNSTLSHALYSSSSGVNMSELRVLSEMALQLTNYVIDTKNTVSKVPELEDIEHIKRWDRQKAYNPSLSLLSPPSSPSSSSPSPSSPSSTATHQQPSLSANSRRPWKKRKRNPTLESILFELDPIAFSTVISSTEKYPNKEEEEEEEEKEKKKRKRSKEKKQAPSSSSSSSSSSSNSNHLNPFQESELTVKGASPLTFYQLMVDIQAALQSDARFESVSDAMRMLTNERGQRLQRIVFSEEELQYQLRNNPELLQRVRALLYESPGSQSMASRAASSTETSTTKTMPPFPSSTEIAESKQQEKEEEEDKEEEKQKEEGKEEEEQPRKRRRRRRMF